MTKKPVLPEIKRGAKALKRSDRYKSVLAGIKKPPEVAVDIDPTLPDKPIKWGKRNP